MTNKIIIGIDIGTTGVRSVAYRAGQTCAMAMATTEYPLFTDQTGVAEQDANTLLLSTLAVMKRTVAELGDSVHDVSGIAISSVLHSFLAISEEGSPLTRLMTWGDSRGQIYLDEVKAQLDVESLYHRTGCPIHPMYSLLKMYWLKKTHPDVFTKAAWFGSIKDVVFHHLTGKRMVDRSIASGSGCYNIQTLEWDKTVLALLGIDDKRMVQVVPTTHYEPMCESVCERIGLPHSVPVVIGAGDGMMANIGVGTIRPGQINITIGTSGAIRMASKEPRTDIKRRTWCYNVTDDRWMLGGAINNGGVSFRWARDKFAETEQRVADKLGLNPYALLTTYAEKVAAGSDGLIILPFFTGERAPNWNADARGTMLGLTLNHDKRHIIRATLEGICYRMRSVLESLEELTGKGEEIRVSGSFTHSTVWLQILADVIGREINVPDVDEGAAYGAAVMGLYALGELESLDKASDLIGIRHTYYPNTQNKASYDRLYGIYLNTYWNLQQQFKDIASFQREKHHSA